MAGRPSKQLMEFMSTYSIDSDEVWEVRAGGAWAIKHAALERVAVEQAIKFNPPTIIEGNASEKIATMLVVGRMGDREEWSVGEASPANNKNAYCYAMAEKRAKDRVALKLLKANGVLYSEDEADDFKRPNPHVTRPTDLVPDVEYDQHGHPLDNIPLGEDGIERLPKAKARVDYEAAEREMLTTKTPEALAKWGAANANRIATYPTDWQAIMRGRYGEHMAELRGVKAA